MAYTKYSLTPSSNTAAPPDGAPEGMLPSAVNDTMRDMMAQIRDCGDGIRDGTYTMTAPKITGGTITGAAFTGNTFTSPVISGGTINNATIGATTATTGKFTTLEATGVTTVQAGTVSLPAITTTGDTNTGIFFPAADTIAFTEGGAESMRIDSSGNVGIGTTSPTTYGATTKLAVVSTGTAATWLVGGTSGGAYAYYSNNAQSSTTNTMQIGQGWATGSDNIGFLNTNGANPLLFATNGVERMRIDSSGNLLVGTTTLDSAEKFNVVRNSITTNALAANFYNSAAVSTTKLASKLMRIASSGNGADVHIGFTDSVANNYYFGGNNAGAYVVANSNGVRLSNGGTSWASDSDERVKDIIEPITDAVNKVSTIRAVIGKYKTDEEGTRRAFLIAQDVQAVLPEAVFDEQGTLMLAYTETIPLLVAAIKELKAELDSVKAELQTLKGN